LHLITIAHRYQGTYKHKQTKYWEHNNIERRRLPSLLCKYNSVFFSLWPLYNYNYIYIYSLRILCLQISCVQRDNATSVHFASLQSALKELYCLQKCRLCNHACAWNLVKAFCNLMIIFICKNQKTKPRTVINENIISYGSRQMENLCTIISGNSSLSFF